MGACNRVFWVSAGENTVLVTCGMFFMGTGKVELCAVCEQARLIDNIQTFDINDYPSHADEHGESPLPGLETDTHDTIDMRDTDEDDTYGMMMSHGGDGPYR